MHKNGKRKRSLAAVYLQALKYKVQRKGFNRTFGCSFDLRPEPEWLDLRLRATSAPGWGWGDTDRKATSVWEPKRLAFTAQGSLLGSCTWEMR